MGRVTGIRGAGIALGVLLVVVLGCASCSSGPGHGKGVTHVLRPGENLYRLSQYYGVSVDAIVRANSIRDVRSLPVGRVLWIPDAKRATSSKSLGTSSAQRPSPAKRGDGPRLSWPIQAPLTSKFGWRNGRKHEGIDIPAKRGTPIHAAQAGRVIHSGGGLGDYGKVVILKHVGRYSTVYAHNRRNRVRVGEFVEQGDVIGEVGDSGNATGPHIHFEVRLDRTPLDPLLFLPGCSTGKQC